MSSIIVAIVERHVLEHDATLGDRAYDKIEHILGKREIHIRFENEDGTIFGDVEMFFVLTPRPDVTRSILVEVIDCFWRNWIEGIANKHGMNTLEQVWGNFGRPANMRIEYESDPKTIWERL